MFTKIIEQLGASPLKVGAQAPDFSLLDQKQQLHTLSGYRGKWVVLFFYPKDNSFLCTKEACSFQDEYAAFKNLNAEVLGISCDSASSHENFAKKYQFDYPLLADSTKEIAKAYGVLLPLGIANRVTFIVNPAGVIAAVVSWANWFEYGRNVKSRLEELQSKM